MKKKIKVEYVGVGEFIEDEKDFIKELELKILIEQAPFYDKKYEKLIKMIEEKRSQKDIANELQTSQATVHRMLKKLRNFLKENL